MVKYDAAIIQDFAGRLYRRANNIIASFVLLGALVSGCAGYAIAHNGIAAIVGLVLGGLIGAAMGQARAFQLKLQAQLALCQLSIEANTRARTGAQASLTPAQVAKAA